MDDQETRQTETKSPRASEGSSKVLGVLTSLILVVAIAVLAIFGLRALRMQQVELNLQQNWLNQQTSVARLQKRIATIQQGLRSIIQQQQTPDKGWTLAEVGYLLRLANYNLILENNVRGAIRALEAADKRLQDLSDPGLSPIRSAIAQNLAALRTVSTFDAASLILQLNALSQQIDKLPIIPSLTQSMQGSTQPSQQAQGTVKSALSTVGENIKKAVVIQRSAAPTARLTIGQRGYLVANIQMKINEAQWAVLNQQGKIYQMSLAQAKTWITQNFEQSNSATQDVLSVLSQLEQRNIQPSLPDLSGTLRALDAVRTQQALGSRASAL